MTAQRYPRVDDRRRTVPVDVHGTTFGIAVDARAGDGDPVLYLHGLGSTKTDFADAFDRAELSRRPLVAMDFPGSGDSPYPAHRPLTIDDLPPIVVAVLDTLGIPRVTVIGHSMGGLVGLLIASRYPERVNCFINVEGNLAPEDCGVFSRETVRLAVTLPPSELARAMRDRLADSGKLGFDTFATRFPDTVDPVAFVDYCRSIVAHSDGGRLLSLFLDLPHPRAFIYGSANRWLPYLGRLRETGIFTYEIPDSDHFPAYSNPDELYAGFQTALGMTA